MKKICTCPQCGKAIDITDHNMIDMIPCMSCAEEFECHEVKDIREFNQCNSCTLKDDPTCENYYC